MDKAEPLQRFTTQDFQPALFPRHRPRHALRRVRGDRQGRLATRIEPVRVGGRLAQTLP